MDDLVEPNTPLKIFEARVVSQRIESEVGLKKVGSIGRLLLVGFFQKANAVSFFPSAVKIVASMYGEMYRVFDCCSSWWRIRSASTRLPENA